jgi:outer membrane receptor protein involved in Fe transport
MDDCCDARTRSPPRPFLTAARWFLIGLLGSVGLPLFAEDAWREDSTLKLLNLEAGNASVQLNEFSRQTDIQTLFDFNVLKDLTTNEVHGTYVPGEALKKLLQGTGLMFDWVNSRTIAITPKHTLGGKLARAFSKWKKKHLHPQSGESDQVIVSAQAENNEAPPSGGRALRFDHGAIERSGAVTTADFLRTRPELFGGGANEGIVLGAEQASNTALGVGANFRGLGAGATVTRLNGHPMAPSGSTDAFVDILSVPLSAINYIDLRPEGGTALYGGEAAGGIINFVLRDRFDGAQTEAHSGFASGRTLGEQQFNQLWGTHWGEASTVAALEFYRREALAASDRVEATSDLRAFGGDNFDSPFGYPPTVLVGSQTWGVRPGQVGRSLSPADLVAGTQSLHDLNEGASIFPSQKRLSFYSRSTLPLTDNTHLFAEILLGDRQFSKNGSGQAGALILPKSNPYYFNPTGDDSQPVEMLYGFLSDLGPTRLSGTVHTGNIAFGFNRLLDSGWNTTGEFGYTFEKQNTRIDGLVDGTALSAALGDSNPATAFDPFGSTNPKTLAGIRSQARFGFNSTLGFAQITADRALLSLPGGDLKLVVGSELRREKLTKSSDISDVSAAETLYRNSWAGFGELRVPLVGPGNRLIGVENLELSVAERIERFSDVGSVSTPSFTALWSPIPSLRLRATDAWIFKPPNLGDLSETDTASEILSLPDAHAATGQSIALIAFGGNHGLQPEKGRSWSLGLDFDTPVLPGLTLALTHYDIYLDGRINSPSLPSDVLDDPRFAPLVSRDFTPEERAAACHRGAFYGDPASCLTVPIIGIVDDRLLNSARVRTRGEDVAAKYSRSTPWGDIEIGLDATYISEFAEALTSTTPLTDIVNTEHNPLRVRGRASMGYRFRRIDASVFANYAGHYRDTASIPERRIAAWTTVDTQVSYDFNTLSESIFSGLRLSVGVRNLLGSRPPFVNNQVGLGWDQENAQPFGRVGSVTLRKRW